MKKMPRVVKLKMKKELVAVKMITKNAPRAVNTKMKN